MGIDLYWIVTVLALGPAWGAVPEVSERDLMQWALHFYDWEPGERQTQRAAIDAGGFTAEISDSMASRVRWRSLLPEAIEGRYSYDDSDGDRFSTREDLDSDLSVMDTQTSTARTLDQGARWYAGARWDLRGLIFEPDEVDIARLSTQRAEDRIDLEGRVAQLYAERRQVQVDLLLNPPVEASDGVRRYLLLNHIGSQLDALTGGWFTAEVQRRRRLGSQVAPE